MARMVRRRFGIPVACTLISILSLPSAEVRADEAPAQSPTGISVRSKDGSASLQGSCKEQGRYTVCDVTEVRIFPPNLKRVDEEARKMLRESNQEFKKDPEKRKKELRDAAVDLKETVAQVRADPTIGPKARRNFEDMLAAAEAQDVKRMVHASVESDR